MIRVTEVETGAIFKYTEYSINITVSSLHPAYTYKFTVAAYTVGLGPYSAPFSITLKEDGLYSVALPNLKHNNYFYTCSSKWFSTAVVWCF